MRFFSLFYNGFIWGLMAAIIAFQNQWLEMRINVGLIIPMAMLLVVAVVLITKKSLYLTGRFTTVNLLASVLLAFLILGSQRLLVVPAAIIREAIKMTDIGFSAINLFLIICLAFGWAVIWMGKPQNR